MRYETWTTEPVLHTHVTDGLPDDDPRAWESIYCIVHGGLVHSIPNECMTAWADTDDGPMCLACLLEALP
jgi:hypothetical protein